MLMFTVTMTMIMMMMTTTMMMIMMIMMINHNYNKIVKSDWLSTPLISALIGQSNRTVRVMPK